MKRLWLLLLILLTLTVLGGCAETMRQIDIESIVTEAVENIDWDQLELYAREGYDTLTTHFPALKSENIKTFLKTNGLDLMNRYIENSDAEMQETAKKLGAILKILNPELTDEVNSVITE